MSRENNSAQGRLSLRPGIVHLQHNKVSIHRSLSYIDQYVDLNLQNLNFITPFRNELISEQYLLDYN